jgi:hypothetical protein
MPIYQKGTNFTKIQDIYLCTGASDFTRICKVYLCTAANTFQLVYDGCTATCDCDTFCDTLCDYFALPENQEKASCTCSHQNNPPTKCGSIPAYDGGTSACAGQTGTFCNYAGSSSWGGVFQPGCYYSEICYNSLLGITATTFGVCWISCDCEPNNCQEYIDNETFQIDADCCNYSCP